MLATTLKSFLADAPPYFASDTCLSFLAFCATVIVFFRRCRAYDIDVRKRIVVAFEQIELFAVNTDDIIQFFFLARKFNLFNAVDFFKLFSSKQLPASYSYRDQ